MTVDQLRRLYRAQPFQPFEMLLADGRSIRVTHLDFLSMSSDGRTVKVYELPEQAEVIGLALVVSLKFNEPELMAGRSLSW